MTHDIQDTNVQPINRSVRTRQIIATVIFSIVSIYNLYRMIFGPIAIYFAPSNTLLNTLLNVEYIIKEVVYLVPFILLFTIASNKATKIASVLFIVGSIVSGLSNALFALNMMIPMWCYNCTLILSGVIFLYGFSLMMQANSDISREHKGWLHYLLIYNTMTTLVLYNQIYGLFFEYPNLKFTNLIGSMIWIMVMMILALISYCKFAQCAAFSGNYDPTPAPAKTYLPFNKYFAAWVVTVIIVCGLWCLLYSNSEIIENVLTF